MELRVLYQHFYVHGPGVGNMKVETDLHDRQQKQASLQKLEAVPQQVIKPTAVTGENAVEKEPDPVKVPETTVAPQAKSIHEEKHEEPKIQRSREHIKPLRRSDPDDAKPSSEKASRDDSFNESDDDGSEVKWKKGGKIGGKHVHAGRAGRKGGGKGRDRKGDKTGKEQHRGERGEGGKWGGRGESYAGHLCPCGEYRACVDIFGISRTISV
jgi:hypothetical protein